jgi:dipeptidyl aminopeptidase/acylaminoacyl peptidase
MGWVFAKHLITALTALCAACGFQHEDVTFPSTGAQIAGTLYLPAGKGPHPAVVFIHGSGPDSREQYRFYGEIFAHRGIAALIYDKRGVGSSTGDWGRSPFPALVDDAQSGVAFLKNHARIDPKRIGVWGGSEGAIVAAWAASRTSDVAFVIMQSATGVPFAEQNLHQTRMQMRAIGLPAGEVDEALEFQRLKHTYARTGRGWSEYAAALQASRQQPWSSLGGPNSPDDWWWRWYGTKMDVDPAQILARVRVPVFAAWGERDHLVPVDRSRTIVAQTLAASGNQDVTLIIVPGADHSLNTPAGPNPSRAYLGPMLAWASEKARIR